MFILYCSSLINDYAVPMKGRYQQQADLLLKGVDIVQQYCNISMDFLSGTEFTTNTSDEAIRKANMVMFLMNLNKYIMW